MHSGRRRPAQRIYKTCCVREGLYKTHIFYKGRHILRRIAGLPERL